MTHNLSHTQTHTPVSTTTHGDLMLPNLEVNSAAEIVLEDHGTATEMEQDLRTQEREREI
jgi:predicted unusual protein kinase regulating ubiquinone biosynthesis (AarF/ABC1/UbiB family)